MTTAAFVEVPKIKIPANLLCLDRVVRQKIYYQSFAPVYAKDVRHNKESFLYESYRQHNEAEMPACKEWARKLGSVHEKISEELPYVVNKIKKEMVKDFAEFMPLGRLHHGLRCDDCEFCVVEEENWAEPPEYCDDAELELFMKLFMEHECGNCFSIECDCEICNEVDSDLDLEDDSLGDASEGHDHDQDGSEDGEDESEPPAAKRQRV
ncbi:hypothetical protein FKW77_001486 [Venturia effusa]|uniref:Uncharacterized protein n=1 Tax=Venturia effusa TaxID=50376 RepID=A0A517KVT6_9PEZI|nr:hypothetical protein FKW77_001486 [Venturia effusa]